MITEAFKSFESSDLTPAQKLLLIALADHANDEDQLCWPSQEHLIKKTGLDRRSVQRSLSTLIDKGYIRIIKKGTNGIIPESTLYQVTLADFCRLSWAASNTNIGGILAKRQAAKSRPNHNNNHKEPRLNEKSKPLHASHKPWKKS